MATMSVSDYTAIERRDQERLRRSPWGGGRAPLGAYAHKVGMWLFLGADALIFLSFLTAYGVIRLYNPYWPDAATVFGGLGLVSLMTFVLITSSATMAAAVAAAARRNLRATRLLLLATIAGGLFFLGSQAYEWSHVIAAGGRPHDNPWGSPLFTASFFTITGFHGLHVLVGVVYLTVTLLKTLRGHGSAKRIEVAGLYWHFVDLIWVLVFTLFYLL